MALQRLLLDPCRHFSLFVMLYTFGMTPWTGDQAVARSLPTQNKCTQTSTPRVGFEPMTPVLERAKIAHALDLAVTVIGRIIRSSRLKFQVGRQKFSTVSSVHLSPGFNEGRRRVTVSWTPAGECFKLCIIVSAFICHQQYQHGSRAGVTPLAFMSLHAGVETRSEVHCLLG
jgi:hypothetical protein